MSTNMMSSRVSGVWYDVLEMNPMSSDAGLESSVIEIKTPSDEFCMEEEDDDDVESTP